jgi:phosphatidylserine/phosphatidylglycerophosphate/cardiolipin synthase-like enzyme
MEEGIMLEKDFLKTMIETIKYTDEYSEIRSNLLAILRYSLIDYDKTGVFATKNNYFREYIDLRVPIPMIKEAKKYKREFTRIASQVYRETDKYEFWDLNIKPKPIESEEDFIKEHDVTFREIKKEIIQGIRNAKYTIWIAVAWFTDEDLFEELILKKNEGLNIRIITSDESTNQKIIGKLEQNFDVKKAPLKGKYLSNRTHDKFCIIDFEYVMHGSFNWSKNANHNDETLATALDRDFAKKFADEFINLYNEN